MKSAWQQLVIKVEFASACFNHEQVHLSTSKLIFKDILKLY